MHRGMMLIFGLLILAAAVVYIILPEGKDDVKIEPQPFFCREAQLVDPPYASVQNGADSIMNRFLDRLDWGHHAAVHWSIEWLKGQNDRPFYGEVIRRIDRYKSSNPARAKKYIDLLAELDEPDALDFLIECTEEPSEMVRKAALRGVSRQEDETATSCLIRHAASVRPAIKALSLQLLVDRSGEEVLRFFKHALEENDEPSLPFAMRVVARELGEGAATTLRPYLNHERFSIRQVALHQLLELGDDAAFRRLEEELGHENQVIRKNAIGALFFSKRLPNDEILEGLARDPIGDLRLQFAAALISRLEDTSEEDRRKIEKILGIMAVEIDPKVKLKALQGLYLAGRQEVANPYLRKIKSAVGNELSESVLFLTELLELRDAAPLLIARFRGDSSLSQKARRDVLNGLAKLKAPEAVELFFEVIRGAWREGEDPGSPLSMECQTAFAVHQLEGDILTHWLEALKADDTDFMDYLFINGARNLEDPRAAEPLLEIAARQDRPLWIRKEALKSFAFLRDPALGARLLEFRSRETDKELSRTAFRVFWNFF